MPTKAPATIPNQVFIGAAWNLVRPKYERAIFKLKKKFPLSFVIVGRDDGQEAEELLMLIKQKLDASSFAIFDATGGNANVSLEFGYAEARGIKRAIYVSTHGASPTATKDHPIIADLAGKKRNQYKQETQLQRLLAELAQKHVYSKRFEAFMRSSFRSSSSGKKKRARAMSLKLIHSLDGAATVRRADLIQSLQAESYSLKECEDLFKRMRKAGLVSSQQGPYSNVRVK